MPSALARILRQQKAAIAERLVAENPMRREDSDDQGAMALAAVDSLLGMVQQPPELLEQMLEELMRGQVNDADDLAPAIDAMQREQTAVQSAVFATYPEAREALDTLAALEQLTADRTRAVIVRIHEHMTEQLQESIRDKQALRVAVQELSTPIIPLYRGILVLPLVGQIDSSRAQDVTEQLLEAIAREQADIVLIDVTGISTLDTNVANHLMQTARAASLLGSQVILVGISAEIAQTLVTLNIDLGGLITLSDLQSGVEHALAQLGLAILPSERQQAR